MGIPSITNYMYLSLYGSQRISGHEWFRTPEALGSNPGWDLATRYSPCTFNIFITRVVFFVFLCFCMYLYRKHVNFYQYHIWNHLTHDPFNFLCIEYLQICCANNIYEIYRTSIREVFAMFTKPLIKNIHLAALKAFYIAIRKLKVCWDFSLFFLYVSLGEIDALTFLWSWLFWLLVN